MAAQGGLARRFQGGLQVTATVAVFLLAWEIAARAFNLPAYILPAPTEIFAELVNRRLQYWNAALFTLQPMLIGFGCAVVIGPG